MLSSTSRKFGQPWPGWTAGQKGGRAGGGWTWQDRQVLVADRCGFSSLTLFNDCGVHQNGKGQGIAAGVGGLGTAPHQAAAHRCPHS